MSTSDAGGGERTAVVRMSRDLVAAATTMTADEARFLVDAYYQMQEDRKRSANRMLSMQAEPHSVIAWLAEQSETLEGQIKRALDKYTDAHAVGEWLKSVYGVGPVIAAGLLANIDIKKARTAGHIWSFAGLDPSVKWEKGKKRPWNASLRTLCWKSGQSFMKFANREECFYGHLYQKRKVYEVVRNDRGGNVERAAAILKEKKFDKSTEAFKWLSGYYSLRSMGQMLELETEKRAAFLAARRLDTPDARSGMLPPAQIDAMARRWTVRIFLAHLQTVWWYIEHGELPPKPYAIEHLGHAHIIEPPNQHIVAGFAAAWGGRRMDPPTHGGGHSEAEEYERWIMAFLDQKVPAPR
jgi:hypothetical protein